MAKKTNATTAQVSATATATNNNATANVVTDNTTKTATDAPKMDEKTINATAFALIDEYHTTTAIRANYATLCARYGIANFKRIFATIKTMRADNISTISTALDERFTFGAVLGAVWRGVVAESDEFATLAQIAKRQYRTNDTTTARQVIADYYTAVDECGAPLSLVVYINDTATTIATAYSVRDLTANNAVSILRTALRNLGRCARGIEIEKTKRATNVRAVGRVVRCFNVVRDNNNRATRGDEDATATEKMRGLSVENWQTLNDYNNNAE